MGVSLVDPADSTSHLSKRWPTVRAVGPRATEWLPSLHETLLPAAIRIVRELAHAHDPRILDDKRPRLFAREVLHQHHDVGTWRSTYPEAITQYALRYAGVDPDTLNERDRAKHDELKETLTMLGTGRDAFNTGLDALEETVIPLLDSADDSDQPTVVLVLDGPAWTDVVDKRTAERALETIALFGKVCDLRLVCSPRLEHHLDRHHSEWYDEHLRLTDRRDGWESSAASSQSESALAAAWDCVGQFTPGGGRLRVLAALSADGECDVRDLKRDTEIDLAKGTVDRYVQELADEHNLVAIDDRPTHNRVSLTETGAAAQELIGPNLGTVHPEQTRLGSDLTGSPHGSTSGVCRADAEDSPTPATNGGNGGSGAVAASSAPQSSSGPSTSSSSEQSLPASTPSAEEWLASTGTASADGYVQWLNGPDGRLDAWTMHDRLLAGRRVEGVTFVDEPIEPFEDGTVSYVSCFEDHAQVLVQWGGALPTLVRITNALLSEKMFSKVLTPSAVGEDLDELYDGAFDDTVHDVLRLGAQVGWFSEDEHDYDSLRDRYSAVRRRLLSKLGEITHAESATEWSELCRDTHGLLASATHLYRAIDIDVTIHIRIPDTATLQAGEQRYQGFCDFFRHTVPKNATYGVHSVYRMLFEERVDKLKHRLSYDFGNDPTADLTASWVVSGPTATAFREDVEQAIAAKATDVRDRIKDGTEQGVVLDIPVADGNGYGALRGVVERHADRMGDVQLGSDERRDIVRLATATLGSEPGRCSPYALADALLTASARSPTAAFSLADVAHGLTQLPAERLLPTLPPTMQRTLKTLLVADEPLGRAAIIERAAISETSYDRHIGELAALGMVEAVGNGGHRQWRAWLIPWWSPLATVDRPRTTATDETTPAPPSRWDDILYRIVCALGCEFDYELFAAPVEWQAVFAALPMLDRWRSFLKIHCNRFINRRTAGCKIARTTGYGLCNEDIPLWSGIATNGVLTSSRSESQYN